MKQVLHTLCGIQVKAHCVEFKQMFVRMKDYSYTGEKQIVIIEMIATTPVAMIASLD